MKIIKKLNDFFSQIKRNKTSEKLDEKAYKN